MVSTRSPGLARPAIDGWHGGPVRHEHRGAAGYGVADQPAGDARLGILTGGIDVEHQHLVGAAQRGTELRGEDPGPAEQVRLEDRDHPSAGDHVAGGREVSGELGRVVRVAVDHLDAVGLALELHPAAGTAVGRQAR